MSDVGELHLDIDSSLDAVPGVGSAVRDLCAREGVSDLEAAQLELAIVEAVSNAIEHAYGGHAGGHVGVHVRINTEHIDADICDEGAPIDPNRVAPKPPQQAIGPLDRESLEERGRGLTIIRGIFDDVIFSRSDERNHLTLTKRRRADEA